MCKEFGDFYGLTLPLPPSSECLFLFRFLCDRVLRFKHYITLSVRKSTLPGSRQSVDEEKTKPAKHATQSVTAEGMPVLEKCQGMAMRKKGSKFQTTKHPPNCPSSYYCCLFDYMLGRLIVVPGLWFMETAALWSFIVCIVYSRVRFSGTRGKVGWEMELVKC